MKLLSIEQVADQWHTLYPTIKEALDHGIGETHMSDILIGLMNSSYQCWIHGEAVGITKFNQYKRYKQLQLVTCTGPGWFEYAETVLPILEQFAKDTGCRNVSVWGRKGWEKAMKPYGYDHAYTVLVKEV